MENVKIKKRFDKMTEKTKRILIEMLADNLVYLHDFETIDKDAIRHMSSLLLLFIEHKSIDQIIEFDNFTTYEKNILFSIIIDGIASIYVDNEYLEYSDIGTNYKQDILQELLAFFNYLTKYSKEKVFMLYTKEIKKYRKKGFSWDSIPE